MIDPSTHMPVLQCYTCYNVTLRGPEEGISGFMHKSRIVMHSGLPRVID